LSKSTNTLPELNLQRYLVYRGLTFSTHDKDLPGTPDIVFSNERMAVFVHGCYWHRHHRCSGARLPNTNTETWLNRFSANVARDQKVSAHLRADGWWVFVVWECEINADPDGAAVRVARALSVRTARELTQDH